MAPSTKAYDELNAREELTVAKDTETHVVHLKNLSAKKNGHRFHPPSVGKRYKYQAEVERASHQAEEENLPNLMLVNCSKWFCQPNEQKADQALQPPV